MSGNNILRAHEISSSVKKEGSSAEETAVGAGIDCRKEDSSYVEKNPVEKKDFMEDAFLQSKKKKLDTILQEMGSVAIAFSGGVDSSLLLAVAARLPDVRVLAVTVSSVSYAARENRDAKKLAGELGVDHRYIEVDQLSLPEFTKNGLERCYYCKKEIFTKIRTLAEKQGIRWVADGGNTDDRTDFRPGRRALRELHIRSPLEEAGFCKKDIRILSNEMGLFTAMKPSYACLASRIPYGEVITGDKLKRVEEAEDFLAGMGFQEVRVRCHGLLARIEIGEEQIAVFAEPEPRIKIIKRFKELGFQYITVDLQGFRSGSLNEALTGKNKNSVVE